jgi:hypothetical protein
MVLTSKELRHTCVMLLAYAGDDGASLKERRPRHNQKKSATHLLPPYVHGIIGYHDSYYFKNISASYFSHM